MEAVAAFNAHPGFTTREGVCGSRTCDVGSSGWIEGEDEHGCPFIAPNPARACECNCGPPPRDFGSPPIDANALESDGSADDARVSEAGIDDASAADE